MSKFFVAAIFLIVLGVALSNAYKTTLSNDEQDQVRQKREVREDIRINGQNAESGRQENQGVIATYWNNFLKRARLPLPAWNITNPLSNIFTPYVIRVDTPSENNNNLQQLDTPAELILLDPATNQYYKVQPVSN